MTRRLLIVSSIRWDYLWQRHQALAVAAAQDGWQVDFLQPHPRNLRQIASFPLRRLRGELLIQAHENRPPTLRVLGLKAWLMPRQLGPYDLAIVYLPDALTEWFLKASRTSCVVYDAVLDWASVPSTWFPPLGWRRSEQRLAALPEGVVTADAIGMADLLRARAIPAQVVPAAADNEFVQAAGPVFEERHPRALYFGSVREEIDIDALTALQDAGVPVDVIGRVEHPQHENRLAAHGIALQAPMPVKALAEAAAKYRVLVLPYRGERARSLMPAKFWNCAATRSWVIAQGLTLPEVPNVVATESTDEFVAAVQRALTTPPPEAVTAPSWAVRWREILHLAETGSESSSAAASRKRLLVISSIRWEFLWQRHQALSVAAAEAGWDVDYKQPWRRSFRGIVPSLWRKLRSTLRRRPSAIGGQVASAREPVPNVRILGPRERLPRGYDLALVYVPFFLSEWMLDQARPSNIIYDAVVDWAAVPPEWHPPVGWRSSERRIAARRNAVVTTDAHGMKQILAERGIKAHVVYPAADAPFLGLSTNSFDKRVPRALYFGAIREEIDLDIFSALKNGGVDVDLVGPVDDAVQDELDRRGLAVKPPVPVDALAALAGQYRVVLLPYRGARAGSIMPAKFWNCVASGAWVVTSGLAHTPDLPCVVRTDKEHIVHDVRVAFTRPPETRERQVPDWMVRWSEMTGLIPNR